MTRFRLPRRRPGDLTVDESRAVVVERLVAAQPADPVDADDHPAGHVLDGDPTVPNSAGTT
jgi:hypothetical protein